LFVSTEGQAITTRAKCPSLAPPTGMPAQLGDSYWLYVVWDPLDNPSPEPLRIQNPVKHFDHIKRDIVAARY